MSYQELDKKYKQLAKKSLGDIYSKIEDLIYEQSIKENRELNDDEKEWLDNNMPF